MSREMVHGQLFRIRVTGRAGNEVTVIELVTVGASADEIRLKLPYVFDFSDFDSYRLDAVDKCQHRVHVASRYVRRIAPNEPDAVIEREDGSRGVWQKVAAIDSPKFVIYATTTCFAKDEHHALRKLLDRLSGGSERVTWFAEPISASSPYATAKDMSVFPIATFVRG